MAGSPKRGFNMPTEAVFFGIDFLDFNVLFALSILITVMVILIMIIVEVYKQEGKPVKKVVVTLVLSYCFFLVARRSYLTVMKVSPMCPIHSFKTQRALDKIYRAEAAGRSSVKAEQELGAAVATAVEKEEKSSGGLFGFMRYLFSMSG